MARKNNKGFSIVEIVIAITILSLLLIPIVTQIGQTFRTNRQTKRQQLANDNAIYIMEDFQKSSLDELMDKYGHVDDGDKESAEDYSEVDVPCNVYDESGNLKDTVSYKARIYPIDSVDLGHENTTFARTVVLDDLSSCLLDKGYRMTTSSLSMTDFMVNDEGNTIKINDKGLITDAVCETATAVGNPNEINLGNMQNMDSTKVAIIGGNATNFDAQAESGFYSLAMNKLKEEDYDSWKQAMYQSSSDSVFNQYYNLDNTSKLTHIYIDEGKDPDDKKYYLVSVDVTYKNSSVADTKEVKRWSDELTYNVYSQKFYTEQCPAVYFEYQPYTAEANYYGSDSTSVETMNNVIYGLDDYIIVENYVKDAKIYLYKPYNDQMNVYSGLTGYETVTEPVMDPDTGMQAVDAEGNPISKIIDDYYVFYRNKSKTDMVNIHIGSETGTGYTTHPAAIYTNIWTDEFSTTAFSGVNLPEYEMIKENADGTHTKGICKNFDGSINKLSDDTRSLARLFTVRVYLTPDDSGANPVSLTGAKGEN